jgi:hypothetical protein
MSEIQDKICRDQFSEYSIVSPNYRASPKHNFNQRKQNSFNSPHRISVAAKRLRKII